MITFLTPKVYVQIPNPPPPPPPHPPSLSNLFLNSALHTCMYTRTYVHTHSVCFPPQFSIALQTELQQRPIQLHVATAETLLRIFRHCPLSKARQYSAQVHHRHKNHFAAFTWLCSHKQYQPQNRFFFLFPFFFFFFFFFNRIPYKLRGNEPKIQAGMKTNKKYANTVSCMLENSVVQQILIQK